MIVIDTSAALNALAASDKDPRLAQRLATAGSLHAPHLIDAEVLQALRGLVRGRVLTADQAEDVRRDFADLPVIRYPIGGIADRAWSLRDNLSAYDACFVSLAEALGCPLVTSDARLARSRVHRAEIEVFDND